VAAGGGGADVRGVVTDRHGLTAGLRQGDSERHRRGAAVALHHGGGADRHRGERGDLRRREGDAGRVESAGVGEGDTAQVAVHLRDVAGPGADRNSAVTGNVNIVGVVERAGGAGDALQVDGADQGAVGIEARDDGVPGGGVDVAIGRDRDAAIVGGRQGEGPQLGHRVGVVDVDRRAGQRVELAIQTDVQVGEVDVAEASGGAVGRVEADDAVGHAAARGHVGGKDVVAELSQTAVA